MRKHVWFWCLCMNRLVNLAPYIFTLLVSLGIFFSFKGLEQNPLLYKKLYARKIASFDSAVKSSVIFLNKLNWDDNATQITQNRIDSLRLFLKPIDFWLRYLEPIQYKLINGPLPVEWETEVFEKYEKPYKRYGAGLTLAYLYAEEENTSKDSLVTLIQLAVDALKAYKHDTIVNELNKPEHFYFANRLHLLNMAAIYTTGFECPNTKKIIPELRAMMQQTHEIYRIFNESSPSFSLSDDYVALYRKATIYSEKQPDDFEKFDHFSFIKNYVNPLFKLNQQLIQQYNLKSTSFIDYSLNNKALSIFSKELYTGQNPLGIYGKIKDPALLEEIEKLGRLLFYDPILSGNNERSCASCHIPGHYFTDTTEKSSLHFNKKDRLPRNSPSLLNADYNHLIMLDGFHISLQNQAEAVMLNPNEMGSKRDELIKKIMSCEEYATVINKLIKYTPSYKEVNLQHIASALTTYYTKFSRFYSPLDEAMNSSGELNSDAREGFNIFMSKAQCATCHFIPHFNGVKPPYVGSEFEVLGVPKDKAFKELSTDRGRYEINPAKETLHAFRTGTLKNIMKTKPYMHNGVFNSMEEVIDFYDAGGGEGRGLKVSNQTLSADSLHLSEIEKTKLIAFLNSLTEKIEFDPPPQKLPVSSIKKLNNRKVNGTY